MHRALRASLQSPLLHPGVHLLWASFCFFRHVEDVWDNQVF